jgi:hypothetical protein
LVKTNLDTISLISKQTDIDDKSGIKAKANELKEKAAIVMQTSALSNGQTDSIVGNDNISTQVSLSGEESLEKAKQNAKDNNLSIVDITDCLKTLKAHYGIEDDNQLVISKTDSTGTDAGGKNVNVQVFNAVTKEKLDMSLCKDDKVNIQIPVAISDKDASAYREFKSQNVDIFDPNDPMFNSRCMSYQLNGYDTTLNYRRHNIYSNNTITCNNGCQFTGLSNDGYASCDCTGVTAGSDFATDTESLPMEIISSVNFDIITCAGQAFNVIVILILEIRW